MRKITFEFIIDDKSSNTQTGFAEGLLGEVNQETLDKEVVEEQNNMVLKYVKEVLQGYRECIDKELEPLGLKCDEHIYGSNAQMNGESCARVGFSLLIIGVKPNTLGRVTEEVMLTINSKRKAFNNKLQILTGDLIVSTGTLTVTSVEEFLKFNKTKLKRIYEYKLLEDSK